MDEGLMKEAASYTLQNSSEALVSIQLLDFKTNFLEAVEELRMRRDAEIHYEEQISKFVIEKQELEWQKESLQHQKEALSKQHTEAMIAFKKQFQARIFAMEAEKGKYLLANETKEREIDGLKETLKILQISKYTLEKKVNEMEQKLQLHMMAKEDHQKSVSEVEKCYAVMTCQFGIIKGTHEKLEQNVVEAIQLNKKLTAVNKRQQSEIDNLKEKLKKTTADLIRSNITCQHKVGEEHFNLTTKEQELQELRQKISMETDLNAKFTEENARLKEEKQEIITSLQHMQQLLCRQTETSVRMEMDLNELKEVYQSLERDNELQREKAKENEEKFLNLQNEYEKAKATWKNELEDLPSENQMHTSQKENKYAQIATEDSNNLEQEAIEVKNAVSFSFDSDEMHIEQNKADMNTGEGKPMAVEGLDYLENYMKRSDMAQPCKENQKDVSAGKALCAVNFITSGLTCGSYVVECEETAVKAAADKTIFDGQHARIEIKPSDNPCSLAQFSAEECKKVSLESVQAVGHSNTETHHQRKSNEHVGVTNEFVSQRNEDISDTHQEGASFTSESFHKVSKLQDNSTSEKMTNSHSETEINPILSEMEESNHTAFHTKDTDECRNIYAAGQTPPRQSNNCVASNILLCKQINTYLDETQSDNSGKNNRCCELRNTCNIPENALPHLSPLSNSLGINTDIANGENINNLPLMGNLSAENPSKDINRNEMQNKQPGKVYPTLREVSGNGSEGGNKTLILNTESICEPQAIDLKANKITVEPHTMVCDKENMRLKKRKESLAGMITEEIIVIGSTEESYSCPIKNSEDLVNGSGKLFFNHPTLDKKSEKMSASLNYPRVNQDESQTVCAPYSKMPFLLKQKVFAQEIKHTGSRKISQSINMNAVVREETLASTHSNRVADTLNTGSINPGPKRNPSEEWNAIAKTFYDPSFPTEHVQTEGPSNLQEKSSQLPSEANAAILSESSHSSEEKGWNSQNISINTQIKNIEKFLYFERLCQPRKRKSEEDLEKTMTADKET
ncbi:coiled-coil domain-containing protein 73 [Tiliqua scincoides]|uniref:coiled-coil domain-containing protein 73 n=1 Tax=Tiliqua scincoides TaxID=71010 RepID=UPI003463651B